MKFNKVFLASIILTFLLVSCAGSEEKKPTPSISPTSTSVPTPQATPTVASIATLQPSPTAEPEVLVKRYDLDWMLEPGETIAYRTAMNAVESASMSFNIDQFFESDAAPTGLLEELENIPFPNEFALISLLQGIDDNRISVRMIVDEVIMPEGQSGSGLSEGVGELFGAMAGTVQLRGELTNEGTISSFYLEQNQRNLLAMFFELPVGPIAVGDSWSIEVNCIAMGNGFIAAESERINRVTFAEIREDVDGRPLAVLDYVIAETVAGEFQMPFSDELVPSDMTCTFFGQGIFDIQAGRWQQLSGEFSIVASGLMSANNVQQFALTPLDDIPPEYLELE